MLLELVGKFERLGPLVPAVGGETPVPLPSPEDLAVEPRTKGSLSLVPAAGGEAPVPPPSLGISDEGFSARPSRLCRKGKQFLDELPAEAPMEPPGKMDEGGRG